MTAHQILIGISVVCFAGAAFGFVVGSAPLLPIGLMFFALGHLA